MTLDEWLEPTALAAVQNRHRRLHRRVRSRARRGSAICCQVAIRAMQQYAPIELNASGAGAANYPPPGGVWLMGDERPALDQAVPRIPLGPISMTLGCCRRGASPRPAIFRLTRPTRAARYGVSPRDRNEARAAS